MSTTLELSTPSGHSKHPEAPVEKLSMLAAAPASVGDPWASYGAQLLKLTNGGIGKQEVACFAGQTLGVDLGNKNPEIVNELIYELGNTIPAWGPTYAPYSALATSYATYLSWIDLGGSTDPNIRSQLNKASSDLNAAQSNFLTVQAKAVKAYQTAKEINPKLTFSQFVNSSYPVYLSAQGALIGAQSAYDKVATLAFGPGYKVIQADANKMSAAMGGGGALDNTMQNANNMACAIGAVAPAGSVSTLPGEEPTDDPSQLQTIYRPSYGLSSFDSIYSQWQSASVNKQYSAGGTISLGASAKAYDWSDTGWSATGGVKFAYGFIKVNGSGGAKSEEISVDWSSASNSVKVEFTGLSILPIAQGPWFDASAIANYHQNLLPGEPPTKTPTFFGPHGSLALLPAKAILGFEPTLTLSFDSATYAQVKSKFSASGSGGIQIGPFTIGGGASKFADKTDIKYDDAKATITVGPQLSTVPMLLAVVCTKLGGH